jgi:hypothetical protein
MCRGGWRFSRKRRLKKYCCLHPLDTRRRRMFCRWREKKNTKWFMTGAGTEAMGRVGVSTGHKFRDHPPGSARKARVNIGVKSLTYGTLRTISFPSIAAWLPLHARQGWRERSEVALRASCPTSHAKFVCGGDIASSSSSNSLGPPSTVASVVSRTDARVLIWAVRHGHRGSLL